MHMRNRILSLCIAVLIPLSAAAKKPVDGGCEVLVTPQVDPDVPFTVTVVKTPSYPGQWFAPTVAVEVTSPVDASLLGPNTYAQTVTQQIDGLGGSNDATSTFVIPVTPNLDVTGTVAIQATVSEPRNRRSNRLIKQATCTADTLLM